MKALTTWIKELLCKHKHKTEFYRSYPERYIKEICEDCGKITYTDI